jgi:hypothetical protein
MGSQKSVTTLVFGFMIRQAVNDWTSFLMSRAG